MDVKSFILGLQVGRQSAGGGGESGGSGGSTEDMISYEDMATCDSHEIINLKNATYVMDYAFFGYTNIKEVSMPKVTQVKSYAFGNCNFLKNPGFSEGLTTIGLYAYRYCTSLTDVTFPWTLKTIEQYAFQSCTKLQTVTFKSKPSSLHAKAFGSCTNLKTINCPWAEGEVPDAPWGAVNSTIVYNYTGG